MEIHIFVWIVFVLCAPYFLVIDESDFGAIDSFI